MPKKVTKKADAPAKTVKPKEKKPLAEKEEIAGPKNPDEEEENADDISPDALEGALDDGDDAYEADMDEDGNDWE